MHRDDVTDSRAFHVDELTSPLREAIQQLALDEPDDGLVHEASSRIAANAPDRIDTLRVEEPYLSRRFIRLQWRTAVTVALAVVAVWLLAQTEAWAQVAEQTRNVVYRAREVGPMTNIPEAGSGIRFLLLMHVAGLVIAHVTMFVAWVSAQIGVGRQMCGSLHAERFIQFSRRAVQISTGLLSVGIAFGGIWAMVEWGSPWRWDPRELAVLLQIAFAVCWLAILARSDGTVPTVEQSAWTACLCFWPFVLLMVLGPRYASDAHSYGYPDRVVPNAVALGALVNVVLLLIGRRWTRPTSISVEGPAQ